MRSQIKNLPRAQMEITIEISPEEYDPFLKKAALDISEKVKIAGFRPGKTPYDIIKREVGEAKIWEGALESAIKKTLVEAIKENNIATVGSPRIEVLKLAVQNPVIYKATVSILPKIEHMVMDGIRVQRKNVVFDEAKFKKEIATLQKMRGKEILVQRAAKKGDKIELDFTISLDRIPIEGGGVKKMPIYLGEKKFISGFEDNVIGLKAGEEKEFPLTFPKNYHQKNLAGKITECRVKILGVYEIQLPEINNRFAQDLQFKDLKDLEQHMKDTLMIQAKVAEEKRMEDEIIDRLIEKNRFSEIPDILINSEAGCLLSEIEETITSQGIPFDDYLSNLKKTRDQMLLDLAPAASKRIKGAVLFREIAKANGITVTEEELRRAQENLEKQYQKNYETLEAIKKPDYKDHLRNVLASQKVMNFLKEKIIKTTDI